MRGEPILDRRDRPRTEDPELHWRGFSPAKAATWRAWENCSSSGISASSLAAVLAAMPGMETSRSCRARRSRVGIDVIADRLLRFSDLLPEKLQMLCNRRTDRCPGDFQSIGLLLSHLLQRVEAANQGLQFGYFRRRRRPSSGLMCLTETGNEDGIQRVGLVAG